MSYTSPTNREISDRRDQLAVFDSWNEKAFLALFACVLTIHDFPKSYLDIGSGTGAMVNMARKIGIRSYGVDVINGPEHWFINHNLEDPMYLAEQHDDKLISVIREGYEQHNDPDPQFDLITCIEVAEHISPRYSNNLVDTISRHTKRGGILVFSSAPPGQSGEHHVNCQPAQYWRDMFYEVGLSYRHDYTLQLSHIWSWVAGPMMWLGSNIQVFDC